MISLKRISKSYSTGRLAVDALSMEVPEGCIFGFIGPNGAGKTTTIKMLTGIISPDEGAVEINGCNMAADPLAAKRMLGYVPDSPDHFLRLTGMEYLNFMADIYRVPKKTRVERVAMLANEFEMGEVLGDKILSYSHGMRQKIVIMGVLVHDPDVWILDEPFTGLDPKAAFNLKNMMRRHADMGKTVFFSTHVLEVAEKLCDKLAVIDKGQLLYYGTMDEMRASNEWGGSLESLFLEMTADE